MSRQVLEQYSCDSAFHRVLAAGTSAVLDLGTAARVRPTDPGADGAKRP